MTAEIIDGAAIAKELTARLAADVIKLTVQGLRRPKLAVIQVGNDIASERYVKMKKKACAEAGIIAQDHKLNADFTQEELVTLIKELNADPEIDGILVQLPLPGHITATDIMAIVAPHKDVDGLTPLSFGLLAQGVPDFVCCTPDGIMRLLDYTQENLRRKKVVVVGASNIVGKPVSLALKMRGATVTVCDIDTPEAMLIDEINRADIVISACGVANRIKGAWLKPGCIVIDAGSPKAEVEFDLAKNVAAWITPVPGGVGPMTIACLLENTVKACIKAQLGISLEAFRTDGPGITQLFNNVRAIVETKRPNPLVVSLQEDDDKRPKLLGV